MLESMYWILDMMKMWCESVGDEPTEAINIHTRTPYVVFTNSGEE